jgi:diguanylate cyclase (GGDEF)-like protein
MRKKRVLILEVNDKNFKSLESVLSKEGFEAVKYVSDSKIDTENFDVVLVNTHIEYLDIEDIQSHLTSSSELNAPVIYLDNSKEIDKELLKRCYEHGASDFIKRPFGAKEVLARITHHSENIYKLREYKLRVDKLAHLATVDQMSKLTSKMQMQAILKYQIGLFKREKTPISILYIGLMSVDKVSSTFGFEYGERLIQTFSKQLKKLLRDSDAVSRWQGSNFMVLLSNTNIKQAETVAKKLNSSLSTTEIMKDTKPLVAFGITEFMEDDSIEEIEQRAKYALKEAKKKEYGKISTC